jgi:DNA-binding CsgD family transcriptional regulator
MEHLKIWIQIGTLIAGMGVLFDTAQARRRYGYPFLRPIWWCFLFLNLGFLMGVISEYLLVNLFTDVLVFKHSVYQEIADPFTSVFFVALVYFLITLDRSFVERKPVKYLASLFAGFVIFIILRMVLGFIVDRPTAVWDAINAVNLGILVFTFVLACMILAHLVFVGQRLENRDKGGALLSLGLFYLGGVALVILSAALAGVHHGLFRVSICLLFNIFPFFWHRRYLGKLGNALTQAIAGADLATLYEKYGVSTRQREIVELILLGKSNRAIAEALFIAPHTVKNHIYNLYQKLGVKSRFELVNLILGHKNK